MNSDRFFTIANSLFSPIPDSVTHGKSRIGFDTRLQEMRWQYPCIFYRDQDDD
jgi:hypothetical protein